jgi:predicted nucleic acid-binding protein
MEWIATVDTRQLIVPAMVLSEVCYTINERKGPSTEAEFLRSLGESEQFVMWAPDGAALTRMALLVQKYGDWPLGGADASVVVAAERFGTPHVATVDRRHFRAIVPRHVECFTLHPEREPA